MAQSPPASRAHVTALEPRRLLAAAVNDVLAIPSDDVRLGRFDHEQIWQPLKNVTPPTRGARSVLNVDEFEPFKLNTGNLRSTLRLAPMEFTAAADEPVEVSIPTPSGAAARFAVVETMVMDPQLAAKFPGIKTYRGQGLDDPSATVRLDLTPLGFHAQVLAPSGTFYIDPYWHRSQTTYASYWRSEVEALPENRQMPKTLPHEEPDALAQTSAVNGDVAALEVERSTGTQLRTYRTAVAATGEYTAFHGGTVTAGQAAIVTAVNRVTGIYETELSVRLQLVPNNNILVFTSTSQDPYTNNNGSTMLGQNQSAIDSRIGSANYDIGHVFSTGGGGVAYLGVVGNPSFKAGGVTGLPSPTGDAFYVDYVAHEMGHQFGGDHTFNTSASSQRSSGAAFEPGSGSTIMAYAGITGSNSDLQPNSDPYFHWKSFDQIIAFVDNTIPGVGTRTSTGNAVPTVNAGSDFTIPANTPFALTAIGSDANGDTLTYSWEQADLGPANLLSSTDNGSSPLFRVYNPTTSPTRTFPKLSSILSGANSTASPSGGLAERLPTVARAMDFRVTVRDNRAGGGGVNVDDMVVNVVNTGAAFLLTSHNSAASFAGGSSQTITWNVAGTTGSGINAPSVNIRLSTDGGNTFPTLLATNVANDGSEAVTIPNTPSTQARIKIEPTNNVFFDINNANLTITAGPTQSPAPGTPDLVAASDTGISSADDVTNRDNSSAAKNLQFTVGNTISGATVRLYADGVLIASAVAAGTSTTLTTTGSSDLLDGTRAITARQVAPGQTESNHSTALDITVDTVAPAAPAAPDLDPTSDSGASDVDDYTNDTTPTLTGSIPPSTASLPVRLLANGSDVGGTTTTTGGAWTITSSALTPNATYAFTATVGDVAGNVSAPSDAVSVTIDTSPPTADVVDVTPDPRMTGVSSVDVTFSQAVTGFDVADLALTRDGAAVLLDGTNAPSSSDGGVTWTIPNLAAATGPSGSYVLTVNAAGSGIADLAGNGLGASASDTWVNNDVATAVADVFVAGTAWNTAYKNSLATSGAGDATYGYRVPAAEQGMTLAWSNLNQISLRFNEDVAVTSGDLAVTGVNVASYGIAAFAYDPVTFTATWTLDRTVPADKLTLSLTNAAVTYSSTLRVLPGDIDRNNAVNIFDFNILKPNLNQSGLGVAAGDINGDNVVNIFDFNDFKTNLGKTAPP